MKNKSNKRSLRKRFITLIEIMIVMFLIALITGVVAYNFRGSLDEGKAFKTKAGMARLESMLSLVLADHPNADLSGTNWQYYIKESKIVHNADALVKDGWGEEYQVSFDPETHNIVVRSNKLEAYARRTPTSLFR